MQSGRRLCSVCGTSVSAAEKTCPSCGADLTIVGARKPVPQPKRGGSTTVLWLVVLVLALLGLGAFAVWPMIGPRPTPTPTIAVAVALPTASATIAPTAIPTLTPVTPEPSPTPAVITHTVKAGETLGGIARFYGASVTDVLTLNNLTNANVVTVGQNLLIPVPAFQSSGPTATPSPLPSLPAPLPGAPTDGQVFAAADVITLQWGAVTVPMEPDGYQVIVEDVTCMCGRRLTFVVVETSFVVPIELAPSDQRPHLFTWSVVAVRAQPTADDDPPVYIPAGPASANRTFVWSP